MGTLVLINLLGGNFDGSYILRHEPPLQEKTDEKKGLTHCSGPCRGFFLCALIKL